MLVIGPYLLCYCSSFPVCCAKLLLLPLVIAWQVFEEVRDKVSAKYQEIQDKQVGWHVSGQHMLLLSM